MTGLAVFWNSSNIEPFVANSLNRHFPPEHHQLLDLNMRTLPRKLALSLPLVAIVAFSISVSAQETESPEKQEKLSPVGSWTWDQNLGDSKISSQLTVMEKDGKYSGKYKDPDRDLEIKNCKLDEGTFSFEISPHPEQPEFVIKFTGKLSADGIKGTMDYTDHNEAKSVAWSASRVDPLDTAAGKWLLEFETPDGTAIEFKIHVQKKGNGLSVSFIDEKTAKVRDVKFKDGALNFESHQVYEEQPVTVEWTLKFEGNQAAGSLYYTFDEAEGEGELDVSGTRVK
jgi:hypothetical protein